MKKADLASQLQRSLTASAYFENTLAGETPANKSVRNYDLEASARGLKHPSSPLMLPLGQPKAMVAAVRTRVSKAIEPEN